MIPSNQFSKIRYDGKMKIVNTKIDVKESGKTILVKLLKQDLTDNDFCELLVKAENNVIIKRDLPKNLDTEYPYETKTYFVYKLSTQETNFLGAGRFEISLRVYNGSTGYSTIVLEEYLIIKD